MFQKLKEYVKILKTTKQLNKIMNIIKDKKIVFDREIKFLKKSIEIKHKVVTSVSKIKIV